MPAIHQFTAGFTPYDAISNEAARFRDIFRRLGFRSEIFSEGRNINKTLREEVLDAAGYASAASPDDLVLLHLSIGSAVNDVFRTLPCRKAILYHNITPAHYFELINVQTAAHLKRGRRQTEALAGVAAVNMADSRFNAGELEALGYQDVRVLPIVLDLDKIPRHVDRATAESLNDGLRHILFVGRCTPNKKIEDLIRVFAYYQKTVEPRSRFIHVGSSAGAERYHALLSAMVDEQRLQNFSFAGSVPQPVLNAYYRGADAFLCMSEHEGFCIPLLESMLHGVPVVAHASAAIPETLDGSGILLDERRFDIAAEALGCVIRDPELRAAVVTGQNERLQRYRHRNLEEELLTHLAPVLPRHD
jgi:glycosyltransferase involved in cell wall biosynthesis